MGPGFFFPEQNGPGMKLTHHSLPSSGKLSNDWNYTSTPHTYLHVVVLHYADGRLYV
jgi:hypothetical protein